MDNDQLMTLIEILRGDLEELTFRVKANEKILFNLESRFEHLTEALLEIKNDEIQQV